jgi:hypothetical protein
MSLTNQFIIAIMAIADNKYLCTLCLKSNRIYKKTYGMKNIRTLFLKAPGKSNLKSERNALVIPHPGQGNPKKCRNKQLMSK